MLSLNVQSNNGQSLVCPEVSGAEWGRAALRSGRERFRPEQAQRQDKSRRVGTGVSRRPQE